MGYRAVKSRIVSFCCSRKQILITFLPGRVCGPSFDVRKSFCLFLIISLCLRSREFLLNRFGRRASVLPSSNSDPGKSKGSARSVLCIDKIV